MFSASQQSENPTTASSLFHLNTFSEEQNQPGLCFPKAPMVASSSELCTCAVRAMLLWAWLWGRVRRFWACRRPETHTDELETLAEEPRHQQTEETLVPFWPWGDMMNCCWSWGLREWPGWTKTNCCRFKPCGCREREREWDRCMLKTDMSHYKIYLYQCFHCHYLKVGGGEHNFCLSLC